MIRYYSTTGKRELHSLEDAVLQGLAPDGGLFFPESIPSLPAGFIENIRNLSLQEIASVVLKPYTTGSVTDPDFRNIIEKAFTFPAPVIMLNSSTGMLELFHGPTLAFKDFGARFMAGLLGYFAAKRKKETVILVATSGDTGSAVASGFYNVPGIKVCILFPKGKVSLLQEKQLTTQGGNVSALEVEGSFDDCQRLVKQAFNDSALKSKLTLSSANSINIARLLPQMLYYFEAYKQTESRYTPIVYSVPSGNLGNICAGLIAKKSGLPVERFVASNNSNAAFTGYLASGTFTARDSVLTLSNAMDVGNPSNLVRITELYGNNYDAIRNDISGYTVSDSETVDAMRYLFDEHGYLTDPHGATGFAALQQYRKNNPGKYIGIILHTAHPAKFKDTIERYLPMQIDIPERLAECLNKPDNKTTIPVDYSLFNDYLLTNF